MSNDKRVINLVHILIVFPLIMLATSPTSLPSFINKELVQKIVFGVAAVGIMYHAVSLYKTFS